MKMKVSSHMLGSIRRSRLSRGQKSNLSSLKRKQLKHCAQFWALEDKTDVGTSPKEAIWQSEGWSTRSPGAREQGFFQVESRRWGWLRDAVNPAVKEKWVEKIEPDSW